MKKREALLDPGILVVDDQAVIRYLLEHSFAYAGLQVHCADCGATALAKLRERRFRFLITDYDMPGMNGLELSEKARELVPGLKVVLETANTSPELRRQAVAQGIEIILHKPFTLQTILNLAWQWTQSPEMPTASTGPPFKPPQDP